MLISYEYIRGLIDGEGCFSFSTIRNGDKKVKLPSFTIRMNIRDKELIEQIRDVLKLKNKVYTYHYRDKYSSKRQPQVVLIIRSFYSIRDIIVPLCHKKLHGYKKVQFLDWINKINSDPMVYPKFKIISQLYKNGHFDNITSFD